MRSGPARLATLAAALAARAAAGDTLDTDFTHLSLPVDGQVLEARFADVDGDGDLDLYVAVTGDYWRQMPDPAFDAKDGRRNFLYVNDGHGRFTDATVPWGLGGETRWTLSALFQDYDQDGREDILVTNDFGHQLVRMQAALHERLDRTRARERDSLRRGGMAVRRRDEMHVRQIEVQLGGKILDALFRPHEHRLDELTDRGRLDSLQRALIARMHDRGPDRSQRPARTDQRFVLTVGM